jgi:hypothetical protein
MRVPVWEAPADVSLDVSFDQGVAAALQTATDLVLRPSNNQMRANSEALLGLVTRPRILANDPAGGLLLIDSEGRGRVVEVFGDLTNAETVLVVVPGVGSNLANFPATGRAKAATLLQAFEDLLVDEVELRVAVVIWLGYFAPTWGEAPRRERAVNGSTELSSGLKRISEYIRAGSHIVALGHSYGSLVIGLCAASMFFPATAVIVAGSPGMGVARRSKLASFPPELPMYALANPGDLIAWCGWFGTPPHRKDFGATRLRDNNLDPSWSSFRSAHSSYFEIGRPAIHSIAIAALSSSSASLPPEVVWNGMRDGRR